MTELTPIRRGRCAGAGNWQTQYQALQMTAREAAELIRDGDTAALRSARQRLLAGLYELPSVEGHLTLEEAVAYSKASALPLSGCRSWGRPGISSAMWSGT